MTIAQLEKEYADILSYKAPKKVELRQNLFDISDTLYKENINSNWYAFFFDTSEAHKLHDLFLSSLCELIYKKSGKSFEMTKCSVYTEFPTGKGRIDLVIYSGEQELEDEKEECYEKAIIIENKINASLNNDLQDYFDAVNTREDKVGVLLTLESINLDNPKYLNITHIELASKVKDNLGNYILNGDDKYLLYLKDFLETIEYITKTIDMTENIRYFIKHSKKIENLLAIRDEAYDHTIDLLKREVQESEVFKYKKKNKTNIVLSVEETNLLFYIYHSELYNSDKYSIELWVNNESDVAHFDETKKREFTSVLKGFQFDWTLQGKKWLCISDKNDFKSPEKGEFEDIGKFLIEAINEEYAEFIKFYKSEILKLK